MAPTGVHATYLQCCQGTDSHLFRISHRPDESAQACELRQHDAEPARFMGELRMQGHRHLGPSYHENVRIRQQHGSGRGERRVRSLFFVRYFWFASSYCFGLVLRASYADNRRTFNIKTELGVNTRLLLLSAFCCLVLVPVLVM